RARPAASRPSRPMGVLDPRRRDEGRRMRTVALGGALAIEDVIGVARAGWPLVLPEAAAARVAHARAFVDRIAVGAGPVYGITTGVGKLKDALIPEEDRRALQLNLLRSHAAGL